MKKKICTFVLAISMSLSFITVSSRAVEVSFKDTSTHWAAEAIEAVVEKNLFQGTSADTFSPDISMDRGMFVTVLGRFARGLGCEIEGTATYEDVPAGEYYAPYVAWASDNGLVQGVGNSQFAPKDPVTREQMCTLFLRFLNYMGYSLPAGESLSFTDSSKISGYAAEAVQVSVALGLIEGSQEADGLVFRPASGATRAEVATVFLRLDQLEGIHSLTPPDPADPADPSADPVEPSDPGGSVIPVDPGQSELTDEEIAKEKEIAGYLQTMVDNFDSMNYIKTTDQAVQTCTKTLMECIRTALGTRTTGVVLTKKYVRTTYASSIAQFKAEYTALTDAQKDQFDNVVVRLEKISHVEAVLDYFGVKTN